MKQPSTIAIDGPAASGKTTLARRLAAQMSYLFFDTGLLYRAITLAALNRGVSIDDESAVSQLAHLLKVDVQMSSDPAIGTTVWVENDDVTAHLRTADVDANVSAVAANAGVRAAMIAQQKRIGERGDVVMVGRDIGTVVMPDADLKIYLDASPEARAERRLIDYQRAGRDVSYDKILDETRKRDAVDSGRAVAPLKPASDAIVLDSTNYSLDEVFALALDLVANWSNQAAETANHER